MSTSTASARNSGGFCDSGSAGNFSDATPLFLIALCHQSSSEVVLYLNVALFRVAQKLPGPTDSRLVIVAANRTDYVYKLSGCNAGVYIMWMCTKKE